ncbi:hypothetical protein Bca52824_077413 [Brassica carinata]|uniref:RNase H type-1 domain-containing protein n=1 Tax=Brassica carinata TaxID=52824 RepID=A0A8X7TY68_BRACI|nr:hypothetical protein Bca52824_077413 [Brassica carinata]
MIDLADLWPLLCSKQCLPPAGITSKSLALWILWSIWKACNKFVFEGFSCAPEDSLSMAITLAREWDSNQPHTGSHKATRAHAPPQYPQDATIVRSDASWSPIGTMAGLGWVLLSPSSQRPFHKLSAAFPQTVHTRKSKYKYLSSIYSPVQSKSYLILEQQKNYLFY